MRKHGIWILLVLLTVKLSAQNLVLNPGIDGFITCPAFGQFSNTYILSWNKPTIASSDYYNFNCAGIQPTIQMPHSGEGYAGIIGYNYGGTEYREYITGTFSSPLTAGTTYNVAFWVSLNDGYIQAIEELGAYLSVTAPGPFSNALHINVVPQIENINGALTDTAGWKKVSGQYVATGGEQFVTIGNFHDDAGTTITQPGTFGSYGAYYFIDDVSVEADSTTSILQLQETLNPIVTLIHRNILQIQLPYTGSWKNPCKVFCYDITGKLVTETSIHNEITQLDLNNCANGIYSVILENQLKEKFVSKIVMTGQRN